MICTSLSHCNCRIESSKGSQEESTKREHEGRQGGILLRCNHYSDCGFDGSLAFGALNCVCTKSWITWEVAACLTRSVQFYMLTKFFVCQSCDFYLHKSCFMYWWYDFNIVFKTGVPYIKCARLKVKCPIRILSDFIENKYIQRQKGQYTISCVDVHFQLVWVTLSAWCECSCHGDAAFRLSIMPCKTKSHGACLVYLSILYDMRFTDRAL